jgi:VWFA-related protein
MLWHTFRRSAWCFVLAHFFLCAMLTGQTSWERKNQDGEKAFREGRLADAKVLFSQALAEAQQFGPNDVRLAPIYNNLALVSFVQNSYIASETFYDKAIAIMEAQGPENSLLLPVLDNLTSLYVKQWAFNKAIQTSWRAYHIREKKFGAANVETAAGLYKLATLYLNNVRLIPQSPSDTFELTPLAQPGLSVNADFNILSNSFENLAAPDDTAKLAIAESLFERVLDVRQKAYGAESTRLIDVLEDLGEVSHAQGKLESADETYSRTVAIIEKSFGPNDRQLVLPLQRLAQWKTQAGDYTQADALYQRALRIGESKLGTADPALGGLLMEYASLLGQMHRPEEAETLTDRAHSLVAQTIRSETPVLATPVPYILRFERSEYNQYTGFQQTCILIRADGRIRVEERQEERTAPVGDPSLPSPGTLGNGMEAPEALADRSGSSPPKVFESSLNGSDFQQLQAILSAKEIRDLQGRYPPRTEVNSSRGETITASILRVDGVQNFVFPDPSAVQPYESGLKPLFKWVSTAEKHKGAAIKGAVANDCSPDTPKAAPGQGLTARPTPAQDPVSTFRADVKLVPVHVVVRDTQGRSVGNLRQSDFQVFDRGELRAITGFSVEHAYSRAHGTSLQPGKPAELPAPARRYTVYLFDDLHLERTELVQARESVDRQLAGFSPETERAAIFTTSGQRGIDFTADTAKLHEVLVHLEPRVKQAASDCPAMNYLMANLIVNKEDSDALHVAAEEALECAFSTRNLESADNAKFKDTAIQMAQSAARQEVEMVQMETRTSLRILKEIVQGISKAPGQRTIVVVSPGIYLPDDESQFNIIDLAIRGNVVVSALDPRGLVSANDIRGDSATEFNPNNLGKAAYIDHSDAKKQAMLEELADSTGGLFFRNRNDMDEGFRLVAAPEYSYVLFFRPPDLKSDGGFHELKVAVTSREKFSVQARKGYYAPEPKR